MTWINIKNLIDIEINGRSNLTLNPSCFNKEILEPSLRDVLSRWNRFNGWGRGKESTFVKAAT